MLDFQMQLTLLTALMLTFSLWVCMCETRKEAYLPIIGLVLSIATALFIGH